MESFAICVLKYRHALRTILEKTGVRTNLGMTDDQILDAISKKMTGAPIQWVTCDKCHVRFPHQLTLDGHLMVDHNQK